MGADSRTALTSLLQAQAQLAGAEVRLAQTRIVAHQDGVVLTRSVEPGDVVQPARTLMVFAADGNAELVFQTRRAKLRLHRVAIARALSRRPPLVLADEPTSNLDTESSADVFALMRRFNRELGTTFLVVTHDPRIADQCDRVVEIVDGRIESDRRR